MSVDQSASTEQQFSPGIRSGQSQGSLGNKNRGWRILYIEDIKFEGVTNNEFDTLLNAIDPTQDNTIKLPDRSGTLQVVYDVTGFGAVGDGVADDTTAIQDAIDAAEAVGGGDVYLPRGVYRCLSGLTIQDGVSLKGDGWACDNTSASQPVNPLSILSFESVVTCITLKSATANNNIWGTRFEGIYLKGNNTSGTGFLAASVRHCYFHLAAERFTSVGLHLDDSNNALSANNYIDYFSFQAGTNAATDSATGLLLNDSGAGFGVTRTYINSIISVGGKNGYGMSVGNHDGGYFAKLDVSVKAGGTGYGLLFDGDQGAQPNPSRKNTVGFLNGTILAEDNSRNTIIWINSEPSSVTINGTASLDYKVIDRNNGKRYQTARFLMSDYLPIEMVGRYSTITGAPTDVLTGGAQIPAVRMATAVDTRVAVTQPLPKTWDDKGTITTVDILFNVPAGAGNIKFEVNSVGVATGGGVGAAGTTATVVVAAGAANILAKATVTLSAAVNSDLEFFRWKIARLGADVLDTFNTNVDIIGVKVHWECAGPHTDGDSWAIPADEV